MHKQARWSLQTRYTTMPSLSCGGGEEHGGMGRGQSVNSSHRARLNKLAAMSWLDREEGSHMPRELTPSDIRVAAIWTVGWVDGPAFQQHKLDEIFDGGVTRMVADT